MIRMADALLSLASHVGSRPILVLLGSDHGAERLALLAGQAFPNTPVLPGDRRAAR